MAKSWFAYGGTGSVILPENYLLAPDVPRCRDGYTVCAIYVENIGLDFPGSLSQNIRTYIANGLTNGVPEPRIPFASEKYVYMRPS
jgi:hypothetical protein